MVMKAERGDAFLASRRGFSCIKKGMFSDVEGPFLERRRAWAGLERGEKCLHVRGVWQTRKAGRRWEEGWGKNGEDNREEAGGGGRKKLISMKIIG